MPWESSARTLDVKPHVLCGPMLRKVTPTSVTVWLALKHADTVRLRVLDVSNTLVMQGSGDTVAIGQNLHIVAVTARPVADALSEGVIYRYDLDFALQNLKLSVATHSATLAYRAFTLPSFCLPPRDLNSAAPSRLVPDSTRQWQRRPGVG